MPEPTIELQRFLGTYQQLLVSMRTLARIGTVAHATVTRALLSRPFAVPSTLRDVAGASSVASGLKRLAREKGEVDAPAAVLDATIKELIRAVFAATEERGGRITRGGGDYTYIVAPILDTVGPLEGVRDAQAHVTSGANPTNALTSSGRGPGQRAKPPADRSPAADAAPPATAARWINAEIDDHEKNEPLESGETYTIAFAVEAEQSSNAVGAAPVAEEVIFPPGVDAVTLTVDLRSSDFEIVALRQTLTLTRTGPSLKKARFGITPLHDGRCELTATIHKDLNFVQEMTIAISVGAKNAKAPTTTSVSRPPSSVPRMMRREVMIVMKPQSGGGYDFWARDERGGKTATLDVQPDQLSGAITDARDALLAVVAHADANGADVFQTQIEIEAPDTAAALRIMASAGAELFRVLFGYPDASADVTEIGDWLRDLASEDDEPLSIQVLSKRAPIPWALLYTGDASDDATIDPRRFLGFRHIIEQLPLVDQLGRGGAAIASDKPKLEVSINLNRTIDDEMRADYVEQQEKFWAGAATDYSRLSVTPRTDTKTFVTALATPTTADQILYFYGHAETKPLGAKGGTASSSLSLSDAKVTLKSLNANASTKVKLAGNPLVFINACESAELSPLFYDGFVPYFMAKGARGVIGTECRTPAIFAAEWAKRFFPRFLNGESLGALFLALRLEFLEQHGNPLGLLYAVHCDGDTQVYPAL